MKKILIIDDEPLVRRSLNRLFKGEYEIIEAQDGASGLQLWREKKPNIVFLDVLMPGLTGPEVLREIESEVRNQAKVILISAYAGSYNKETAKSLGADLFILKPFEDIFAIKNVVSSL
jgi:two-component system, response regulator PdtaR